MVEFPNISPIASPTETNLINFTNVVLIQIQKRDRCVREGSNEGGGERSTLGVSFHDFANNTRLSAFENFVAFC